MVRWAPPTVNVVVLNASSVVLGSLSVSAGTTCLLCLFSAERVSRAVPLVRVGQAAPRQLRGRRRRQKKTACVDCPGFNVLQAAAVPEGAPEPRRRVTTANRTIVDILTLNSFGRPQLLAALQVPNGEISLLARSIIATGQPSWTYSMTPRH